MSKSPLKDNPLGNPGQSLDEELRELLVDKVLPCFLAAAFFTGFAVLDWIRWYSGSAPNPFLLPAIAVPTFLFFGYKFARARDQAKRIKLGRDGETP